MDYSYFIAFSIGLLSVVHCLGMCSGIVGALSFSLPQEIQGNKQRLFPFILSYNLGRIFSYTFAGFLLGSISTELFAFISPQFGHKILQWFSAIILLIIGLHVSGWFPKLQTIESIGQPLWRKLEPLGRRMLPVKSLPQAFVFGVVWGWLPCGLVYSALIWASSAGNGTPLTSATLMLLFGLGTLPTVLTAGILTNLLRRLTQQTNFRRFAGILLISLAIISPFYAIGPEHHNHNNNQTFTWGNTDEIKHIE